MTNKESHTKTVNLDDIPWERREPFIGCAVSCGGYKGWLSDIGFDASTITHCQGDKLVESTFINKHITLFPHEPSMPAPGDDPENPTFTDFPEVLTREDVISILETARENGDKPDFREKDLSFLDLSNLDFSQANMKKANLHRTNLSSCIMKAVNLAEANMSQTYLPYTDLSESDMEKVNLSEATVLETNMSWAYFYGANLEGIRWYDNDLRGQHWDGLVIDNLPTGRIILFPTPSGWIVTTMYWSGTLDEMRDLLEKDSEWPESLAVEEEPDLMTEEDEMRLPTAAQLEAVLALCDAFIEGRKDVVPKLRKYWNES